MRSGNITSAAAGGSFLTTIILATILMGSSFPSGKYLIHTVQIPPFLLGGWRFGLAGVVMLMLYAFRHGITSIVPTSKGSFARGLGKVFIVGCLQTAGTMGFLNLALETLSSSMSATILFTNPLWLAILAHFYLHDRLSGRKFFALLLGIAGVAICLGFSGKASPLGMLFALAGSLCWSVCTLITKKSVFDKSAFVFTGWQLTLGAAVMLLVSAILGEEFDLRQAGPWAYVWFFWLVIPASIGSFGLWFSALAQQGATFASSFLFLVPIFSVVFAILFLDEHLSGQFVIGSSLIIFALWRLTAVTPARWWSALMAKRRSASLSR